MTKNTGQFKKGLIPWNKGVTMHLSTKSEFKKGMTPWNKVIKNPEMSGSKHPMWKGGKTTAEYKCPDCDGFKSTKQTLRCLSCKAKYQKGEKCYNYKGGKPKCADCGELTTQYNTTRCYRCWIKSMVGEGSPHWKGGITPIVTKVRTSIKMRQWIMGVFERDNFVCHGCQKYSGELHAHHIKTFSQIVSEIKERCKNENLFEEIMKDEDMWNIDNGQTLCRKCHHAIHSKKIQLITNIL
jgi:hypothetical protein